MMNKIVVFGLLLIFSMPVCLLAGTAKNISPEGAYGLLEQSQDVFLLDVRTPGEYQQFHLEGARLVPIDRLLKGLSAPPKDRPILVYCAVGSRSAQAINYLARRGYPELYNLYGGIYSWAQKGYPVLRGGP